MAELGSQVVSPGGGNSWLVSWDHSTVGVGNQGWDTSKGTSIADGTSVSNGASSNWGNSWGNGGNSWAGNVSWAGGNGSMEGSTLGGQVVSPGSNNSWLISRGHSTVRVGNQSRDTSKGSNIWATGNGASNGTSIADGASGDWASNWGNGWASNISWARGNGSLKGNTLSGQMVSPGGNNSWLVSWGHSTIGVGDQLGHMDWQSWVVLGAGNSSGSKDSLKSVKEYFKSD